MRNFADLHANWAAGGFGNRSIRVKGVEMIVTTRRKICNYILDIIGA